MTVIFIGMGLCDEGGLTLEGLEEARGAHTVFAELYTNLMPTLDLKKLESEVGKPIVVLNRSQLEDGARPIVEAASGHAVALLVPGDPMVATTHVSIRLELAKRGISSRIIHGASIVSAICGATGLQSYKFGKSVTLPQGPVVPVSVLETIRDNLSRGLHTLLLLDVSVESSVQLTIGEAARSLVRADLDFESLLAVGAARLGSRDEKALASTLGKMKNQDFGGPPHSLVVPGKLHFMEVEALRVFCGAKDSDLRISK
jgi:diphthine synthase